jgi:WD40 repeat protein
MNNKKNFLDLRNEWENARKTIDFNIEKDKSKKEILDKLQKLLEESINAGEYISDSIERKKLKWMIQEIGDEIFWLTKRYPNVAIKPLLENTKAQPFYYAKVDWDGAASITEFYGRTEEIDQLKNNILKNRFNLVSIYGMGGMGKTTLTKKLTEEIVDEFDYLVWRSIRKANYEYIMNDIIYFFQHNKKIDKNFFTKSSVSILLNIFKQHKCLLILDEMESAFDSKSEPGKFSEENEGYDELLKVLGESEHQSCLIITSREEPKQVKRLSSLRPKKVFSLELEGLPIENAQEILKEKLNSVENIESRKLINLYSGNPLFLSLVASYIAESYYKGDIQKYLEARDNKPFFGKQGHDIRDVLDWHFKRYNNDEKAISFWLSINIEPVSKKELSSDIISNSEFKLEETIESLERRGYLQITERGTLSLPQVFKEFFIEKLIDTFTREITSCLNYINKYLEDNDIENINKYLKGKSIEDIIEFKDEFKKKIRNNINYLNQYCFMKAITKEYIREEQKQKIIKSLEKRLISPFKNKDELAQELRLILENLPKVPGYAAGNILNLLVSLGASLDNLNLSGLTIWQAYLQSQSLRNTNLSYCDLKKSNFDESFGSVLTVAFSPPQSNNKLVNNLAIGDANGTIHLLQDVNPNPVDTNQTIFTNEDNGFIRQIRQVVFSSDGQYLVSGSDDKILRIWDVANGKSVKKLEGHKNGIWTVAYSSDDKYIASGSDDGTLRIWDADLTKTITDPCLDKKKIGWVRTVAFSSDCQYLVSGSDDEPLIRIWKFDGKNLKFEKVLDGHEFSIWAVAFSKYSQWLASGDKGGNLKIWNGTTYELIQTIEKAHQDAIQFIAFSPNHKFIATASDDTDVKIWQWNDEDKSWQEQHQLKKHSSRVWSVSFSYDSQILASSSDDQTVRLWDVETGKHLKLFQGYSSKVLSVTFRPTTKGKIVASGHEDRKIRLWDTSTQKCIQVLPSDTSNDGHLSWIWSVAFSPDGKYLASGSDDETIRIWDIETGKVLHKLTEHTNWIRVVRYNHDGSRLASAGDDKTIKIWNASSGICLKTLEGHNNWVWSVSFSPDGSKLASASDDKTIKIWDVNTYQCLHTLSGHKEGVWSVNYSRDGRQIVSGSEDGTIRIWNAESGKEEKLLGSHEHGVRSVSFSRDGLRVVSGSEDGTIRIWNVSKDEWQSLGKFKDRVRSVAFNADQLNQEKSDEPSPMIVCGSDDQSIQVWNDNNSLIATMATEKPYDKLNITGAKGLSNAQKTMMEQLGALKDNSSRNTSILGKNYGNPQ